MTFYNYMRRQTVIWCILLLTAAVSAQVGYDYIAIYRDYATIAALCRYDVDLDFSRPSISCSGGRRAWTADILARVGVLTPRPIVVGVSCRTELVLSDSDITPLFVRAPCIGSVDFYDCKITGTCFASMCAPGELTSLRLVRCPISVAGARAIGSCPRLELVDLSSSPVTDSMVQNLATLRNLRVLNLGRTLVTDAGLQKLASLDKVEDLELIALPVTEKSICALRCLPRLRELYLADTRVKSLPMSAGGHPWALEALELTNTAVDNAITEVLSAMPHLRDLRIGGTRITLEAIVRSPLTERLRLLQVGPDRLRRAEVNELERRNPMLVIVP